MFKPLFRSLSSRRSRFRARRSASTTRYYDQTRASHDYGEEGSDWCTWYVRAASNHVYDSMTRGDKEELASANIFLECAISHSLGLCSCVKRSKSQTLQLGDCPLRHSTRFTGESQDSASPKRNQSLTSEIAVAFVNHTDKFSGKIQHRNALELSADEANGVRASLCSEKVFSTNMTGKKELSYPGRRMRYQPHILTLTTIYEED